jgi:hypothetical protein
VASPRRRLSLVRVAALPEARAERRAGGRVENGFYVLGLRAEALERQNGLDRRKNTRKAGEGSPGVPVLDGPPSPRSGPFVVLGGLTARREGVSVMQRGRAESAQ